MKAGEHFFVDSCPLSILGEHISMEINKPVVAELGDLPETYDDVYTIFFPYEKGNVTSFVESLEKNVGFTLVLDKREVELLVVRKADRELSSASKPETKR